MPSFPPTLPPRIPTRFLTWPRLTSAPDGVKGPSEPPAPAAAFLEGCPHVSPDPAGPGFAALCPGVRADTGEKDQTPPPPQFELGFEERFRSENWDNLADWDSERSDTLRQVRFRTRLWASVPLGSQATFYVSLNNETRKISKPDTPFRFDEIIFESCYLDVKFNQVFSVRAGRQNLARGEGLILADGGPLDGSRSYYYNALDAAVALPAGKLEFLAISDPHKDIYLPTLNDRDRTLVEWDEQALGGYFTSRPLAGATVEAYYFYKIEVHDQRPPDNPQYQPERRLSTLGARVTKPLGRGWSFAGEYARQWGRQHPDTDIAAWGGYAYARKKFAAAWEPTATAGFWALSGDDPATPANENWDPLFSRWPKWSDLYIYSQVPENGAAYWTNLGMGQAEAHRHPPQAAHPARHVLLPVGVAPVPRQPRRVRRRHRPRPPAAGPPGL